MLSFLVADWDGREIGKNGYFSSVCLVIGVDTLCYNKLLGIIFQCWWTLSWNCCCSNSMLQIKCIRQLLALWFEVKFTNSEKTYSMSRKWSNCCDWFEYNLVFAKNIGFRNSRMKSWVWHKCTCRPLLQNISCPSASILVGPTCLVYFFQLEVVKTIQKSTTESMRHVITP